MNGVYQSVSVIFAETFTYNNLFLSSMILLTYVRWFHSSIKLCLHSLPRIHLTLY